MKTAKKFYNKSEFLYHIVSLHVSSGFHINFSIFVPSKRSSLPPFIPVIVK